MRSSKISFTNKHLCFPEAYGFPSGFANDLHKSASSWNATGELEFLNDWSVYPCPRDQSSILLLIGRISLALNVSTLCILDLTGYHLTISFQVLTPFGRQQLYDLGSSMRIKYGFLLQVCTPKSSSFITR